MYKTRRNYNPLSVQWVHKIMKKISSYYLALLLIISFALSPVSIAIAAAEVGSGSKPTSNPRGTLNTNPNDENDDDSDDDSDSDGGDESEEDKDQRLAEETATVIKEAASAAGISLTVDPVYGSSPSGSSVSVNGISVSKEAALSAISALGSAKDAGSLSAVDTNKTLAAYGGGGMCSGCVVGLYTAVTGPVSRVAEAEANYLIERNRVGSLRNINSASALPAKNIGDVVNAIIKSGPSSVPQVTEIFDIFGNAIKQTRSSGQPTLTKTYQEHANTVSQNGSILNNVGYTYDSVTGNFIDKQNGRSVPASSVPHAEQIKSLAARDNKNVVSVDTSKTNNRITVKNTETGKTSSYEVRSTNNGNNVMFDVSARDLLFSPDALGANSGKFIVASPMQSTYTGRESVIFTSGSIRELAEKYANVLVGENTPITKKIGLGLNLSVDEMMEAIGLPGVMINRSAVTGRPMEYWLNKNDFSSLDGAYKIRLAELESNPNYNHAKVVDFLEDLFAGNMFGSGVFVLQDINDLTPAPFATHFYSGPRNAISWSPSIVPGTEKKIGEHNFVNLLLGDGSAQEYKVKTSGLPDNVQVFNVVKKSLGEVGQFIKYSEIYSGSFLTDSEMSGILGPVFNQQLLTRVLEQEEIISITDGTVPTGSGSGTSINTSRPTTPTITTTQPTDSNNSAEVNRIILANDGKARSQPITNTLSSQINYAASKNGVTVRVTSGGQMPLAEAKKLGATKNSTGDWVLPSGERVRHGDAANHDHGNAADIVLIDEKTGKELSQNNPEDRDRIASFIADAIAAGAKGIGAGSDYMNDKTIHVGGSAHDIVWGQGGKSANAPQWLRAAHEEGKERRENFDSSQLIQTSVAKPSSQTQTTSGGSNLLGGLFNSAKGAVGEAIGNLPSNIIPTEGVNADMLKFAIQNPELAVLFMRIRGAFSGAGGTLSPIDSNSSTGSSETPEGGITPSTAEFQCPPRSQLTQSFLSSITDLSLLQKLISCLNQSSNTTNSQQSGTALLAWLNSGMSTLLSSILKPNNEEVAQDNTDNRVIIPVSITINEREQEISFSREDIKETLEKNIDHYLNNEEELLSIVSILEEDPFVLDDAGEVIYSNGLYSPPVINGQIVGTYNPDDYDFIYTVQYEDENGNISPVNDNGNNLPENGLTNLIAKVLTNRSPFTLEQITSIEFRIIDPSKQVAKDEYYDYVINLVDGSKRAVIVPQYSSVSLMRERFSSVGYQGDVLALISQATATTESPKGSLLTRLLNTIKNQMGAFTDSNNPEHTNLPQFERTPTASQVQSVFIYPTTDISCPAGGVGFAYTAVIDDPEDTNYFYLITDGRCGEGSTEDTVTETARHLSQKYLVTDADIATIVNKTSFQTEATIFDPGILHLTKETQTTNTIEPSIPSGTDPVIETPTTTTQLPNLTNTIKFEVKAVGSDGKVLADWVDTEKITISPTVQLHFRWEANDYQQCLPFLNDNGNYSLTRSNRAMITGDTESESYNVTRRTGVYRIECGGQRNNEFGVDFREIEVVVN